MIQISSNPVDTISTLAFFLGFFAIGLILMLRPQVGVRLIAQSLQSYQRTYNLSDEQLERMPMVFSRSVVGGSVSEFARNGKQHPETFPKALRFVRFAGIVVSGFMLVPACLVLLLVLIFGATYVSSSPEFQMTFARLTIAAFWMIPVGISRWRHDIIGLYEGYESSEVVRVVVTNRLSTNPSVSGTNAQVSGTITYTGGIQGSFEAGIERENGQWRLSKVWIVVPPEKLEGNPEANRQLDEDLTA